MSHFAWRRQRGSESEPDIRNALAAEPARQRQGELLGCYGLHSRYESGLQAWADMYPADRLCILVAEKLFGGDTDELDRLRHFLGITTWPAVPRTNVGPSRGRVPQEVSELFSPSIQAVESIIGRPTGWSRDHE
jgi:hypothetical protein